MALIKRYIKLLMASVLYYGGAIALSNYIKRMIIQNGDCAVLMYHRVVDNPETEHDHTELGLFVSTDTFEKQIAYLSRKYNVIPLGQLVDALIEGKTLPRRSIAITFDDGWRDNFTHAYPILKKYKTPATIFLTTDFIGTGKVMWFQQVGLVLGSEKLSAEQIIKIVRSETEEGKAPTPEWLLNRKRAIEIVSDLSLFLQELKLIDFSITEYIIERMKIEADFSSDDWKDNGWIMSWADAREMEFEIIQFGSHGESHRIMTGLLAEELARELFQSKDVMERELARPIDLVAYPNGDYNDSVIQQVKAAGYIAAFATTGMGEKQSNPNLFAVRRIAVGEWMSTSPSGRFSKVMFAFGVSNLRNFPEVGL